MNAPELADRVRVKGEELATLVEGLVGENVELRRRVVMLEAQLADALDGYQQVHSENVELKQLNEELRQLDQNQNRAPKARLKGR